MHTSRGQIAIYVSGVCSQSTNWLANSFWRVWSCLLWACYSILCLKWDLLNCIWISDSAPCAYFLKEEITPHPLWLHSYALAQLMMFPKLISFPSYVQWFEMGLRNSTRSSVLRRHTQYILIGLAHTGRCSPSESISMTLSSNSVIHQVVIFVMRIVVVNIRDTALIIIL